MGIYKTNDDTREYFPEQYYLWIEDEITEYYNSLEGLILDVETITGAKNLNTLDSCRKALESYSRSLHNGCYSLEEFKVIED